MQFDEVCHLVGFQKMRLYPVIALMTSAFALAACGGGGGGGFGGSVLGVSGGVASSCPITPVDGTPDPSCVKPTTPVNPGPVIVDADGDGVDDNLDEDNDGVPDDDDGNVGGGAGGNTTGLTTGNRSIFLTKNVIDKPTTGVAALSTVSSDTTTTLASTTAAILSTNKPKKLLFQTDTKSAKNATLAVAQIQSEYIEGTRDLRWLELGHSTASWGAIAAAVVDKNGNPLAVGGNGFVYSADDPAGEFAAGEDIDLKDDAIWNQIAPFMSAKANGGAGANYREYRLSSNNELNPRDESLQVWAWQDSYAMQYRNGATNGEPKHEIWSFGGNAATVVPSGGKATYRGRWVGTAKTQNWKQPQGSDINPNALWRLQGRSTLIADFDSSTVKGSAVTETWTSKQTDQPDYTWYTDASGTPSFGTAEEPEFSFYNDSVLIDAKLVNDGTATGVKNQIVGNASIKGGYQVNDNSVLGGLFGTNGTEATAVFHVSTTLPSPIGGSTGLTDGGAGVLIINGAINACVQNPDGTCVGSTP
jgi:hypothetical protein